MAHQRTAQASMGSGQLLWAEDRLTLVENFEQPPGVNGDLASSTEATRVPANRNFEVLGTNADSGDVTLDGEGGIKCETDGSDDDSIIITPHLDTQQTLWAVADWSTSAQVHFGCILELGSAITLQTVWAGLKLTNTPLAITDNDQAYFRYEGAASAVNGGRWQAIASASGTDDTNDTGVWGHAAAVLSTQYKLDIRIDAARVPRFYINGRLASVNAALTANASLIPYMAVEAGEGAAKHCYFRKCWISRVFQT